MVLLYLLQGRGGRRKNPLSGREREGVGGGKVKRFAQVLLKRNRTEKKGGVEKKWRPKIIIKERALREKKK